LGLKIAGLMRSKKVRNLSCSSGALAILPLPPNHQTLTPFSTMLWERCFKNVVSSLNKVCLSKFGTKSNEFNYGVDRVLRANSE